MSKIKCEFVSWVAPIDYRSGCGPTTTFHQCNTHGWASGGAMMMITPASNSEALCPIGRIEQAVEDGLEKLRLLRGSK
jgi:hypothetical protein